MHRGFRTHQGSSGGSVGGTCKGSIGPFCKRRAVMDVSQLVCLGGSSVDAEGERAVELSVERSGVPPVAAVSSSWRDSSDIDDQLSVESSRSPSRQRLSSSASRVLAFSRLTFAVRDRSSQRERRLVDDVSGRCERATVNAVMGASGSGTAAASDARARVRETRPPVPRRDSPGRGGACCLRRAPGVVRRQDDAPVAADAHGPVEGDLVREDHAVRPCSDGATLPPELFRGESAR